MFCANLLPQGVRWALEAKGVWNCQEIQFVRPRWGEGTTQPNHMSIYLSFSDEGAAENCLMKLHDKYVEGISSNKRALPELACA